MLLSILSQAEASYQQGTHYVAVPLRSNTRLSMTKGLRYLALLPPRASLRFPQWCFPHDGQLSRGMSGHPIAADLKANEAKPTISLFDWPKAKSRGPCEKTANAVVMAAMRVEGYLVTSSGFII